MQPRWTSRLVSMAVIAGLIFAVSPPTARADVGEVTRPKPWNPSTMGRQLVVSAFAGTAFNTVLVYGLINAEFSYDPDPLENLGPAAFYTLGVASVAMTTGLKIPASTIALGGPVGEADGETPGSLPGALWGGLIGGALGTGAALALDRSDHGLDSFGRSLMWGSMLSVPATVGSVLGYHIG